MLRVGGVALLLYLLYGVLAFAGRVVVHLRRTGSSGVKGVSGRPGSVEWIAGVLFIAAIALGVVGAAVDALDVLRPVEPLDGTAVRAVGITLFTVGLAGTILAQAAMGASWRIGVDEEERTELVTDGPFAVVRNPIYAAMIPAIGGLALLVANAVSLGAWALLVVALELQTRVVEEPHLLRAHGERYTSYAARVGRFLPGLGRLRADRRPS